MLCLMLKSHHYFVVCKAYHVAFHCLHIGFDSIDWVTCLKYLGLGMFLMLGIS